MPLCILFGHDLLAPRFESGHGRQPVSFRALPLLLYLRSVIQRRDLYSLYWKIARHWVNRTVNGENSLVDYEEQLPLVDEVDLPLLHFLPQLCQRALVLAQKCALVHIFVHAGLVANAFRAFRELESAQSLCNKTSRLRLAKRVEPPCSLLSGATANTPLVTSGPENASSAGEIVAIIVVLQFPPKLSSRKRVSLESRNGMWALTPFVSVSADMTFPSALSEALILLLSSKRFPAAKHDSHAKQ